MSDTLSFVDADVGDVTDDGIFENFVAYFLILQGLWIKKLKKIINVQKQFEFFLTSIIDRVW